jgi:hypothetical protein
LFSIGSRGEIGFHRRQGIFRLVKRQQVSTAENSSKATVNKLNQLCGIVNVLSVFIMANSWNSNARKTSSGLHPLDVSFFVWCNVGDAGSW